MFRLSKTYKPLWLDRELIGLVEEFIEKHLVINPSLGSLFNDVARQAIRFALSKPEEFKEFLGKTKKR